MFAAARAGGRVLVGYHERASSKLVQVEQCAVVTPAIAAALPLLRRLGELAAPSAASCASPCWTPRPGST
ncbi:hypothetical protein [Breoghania sp. L-A4]|uniref:hypothetical protein n=1 Tax=Breoghania sp. L-A4 TaxID=2304600 RepID=UPI003204EED5